MQYVFVGVMLAHRVLIQPILRLRGIGRIGKLIGKRLIADARRIELAAFLVKLGRLHPLLGNRLADLHAIGIQIFYTRIAGKTRLEIVDRIDGLLAADPGLLR